MKAVSLDLWAPSEAFFAQETKPSSPDVLYKAYPVSRALAISWV